MPKVRWLVSVAGEDFVRKPGEITDESETFASVWADGERAVRIEREQRVETATAPQPENTARRVRVIRREG